MPRSRATAQSIERQILALQSKADAIRSEGRSGAIAEIKAAMKAYDIELHELFSGRSRAPRSPAGPVAAVIQAKRGVAPVKYRDGVNTWAGRGKRPTWLVERLRAGASLDDFKV